MKLNQKKKKINTSLIFAPSAPIIAPTQSAGTFISITVCRVLIPASVCSMILK